MKKSSIFIIGILVGTLFMSQHLFSRSVEEPYGVDPETTEIKVFPNPSDGHFQLTFEYNGKEKVTANIDLETPSSGIYFIRIEMGKQLLTKKIIIR